MKLHLLKQDAVRGNQRHIWSIKSLITLNFKISRIINDVLTNTLAAILPFIYRNTEAKWWD